LVAEPQQARKRRRVVVLDSIEEGVGEGAFVAGAAVNAFASQPSEVVEELPRRRVAFARAVASVAANAAVELKEDVSRAAATGGPAQSRKRPRGGADNAELASLACMFQEVRPPSASCGTGAGCHVENERRSHHTLTWCRPRQVDDQPLDEEETEVPAPPPYRAAPLPTRSALGTPTPVRAQAMWPSLKGDYDAYVAALKGRASPMPMAQFVSMRARSPHGMGMPRLPPAVLATVEEEDHEVEQRK